MNDRFVPISAVVVDDETKRDVLAVLESGQLAQGPMVERLEAQFRALCGVEHAVAVSSGTTALVATLQALGVGPGDEVVTSPFTFVATLNAVLEVGATARFVDITPDDFTIDVDQLGDAMSDRTRVVMPVHLYGHPARMDAVVQVASRAGATIVEDAAQAHGATVDGRPVGSFGAGCFSLYATKNVTAGEGGVVTTDDAALADRLRVLRNQGMRARYEYELAGHNYRLTDLQAAVAVSQVARLAEANARRAKNAEYLSAHLGGVPGLRLPSIRHGCTHAFHQYTVRVTDEAHLDRDELAAALAAAGIGTGVYYPRTVVDYECYRVDRRVVAGPLPEARRAAREVLSLPVHPHLTPTDRERVVAAVRAALGS